MPKFTPLERQIIRIAHSYPKGSEERSLLREVLAVHFKTEKAWEEYKEKHPDADEKNHVLEFKKDEDKKEDEGEGETEDPKPGSNEEKKILDKAKEEAKEKFKKGWDKAKKKLKGIAGKVKKLNEAPDEETFGEVVEMCAGLMNAILFPNEGGGDFLDAVMDRVDAKEAEKEEVARAMAALKAAEMLALASPDLRKRLEGNGITAVSEEDLEKYGKVADSFKSGLSDADLDDEIRQAFFEFLSQDVTKEHIEFLKEHADDKGGFDYGTAQDSLFKGLSKKTPSGKKKDTTEENVERQKVPKTEAEAKAKLKELEDKVKTDQLEKELG
jgi:hypothetical protein